MACECLAGGRLFDRSDRARTEGERDAFDPVPHGSPGRKQFGYRGRMAHAILGPHEEALWRSVALPEGTAASPSVHGCNGVRTTALARTTRVSEGGFEPPAPGSLPRNVVACPAMSPVLYRAEPLRQGCTAPEVRAESHADVALPALTSGASSGSGGPSAAAAVSSAGASSDIVPRTSERRISIFFRGYSVFTP
jgi:hypothetical protein